MEKEKGFSFGQPEAAAPPQQSGEVSGGKETKKSKKKSLFGEAAIYMAQPEFASKDTQQNPQNKDEDRSAKFPNAAWGDMFDRHSDKDSTPKDNDEKPDSDLKKESAGTKVDTEAEAKHAPELVDELLESERAEAAIRIARENARANREELEELDPDSPAGQAAIKAERLNNAIADMLETTNDPVDETIDKVFDEVVAPVSTPEAAGSRQKSEETQAPVPEATIETPLGATARPEGVASRLEDVVPPDLGPDAGGGYGDAGVPTAEGNFDHLPPPPRGPEGPFGPFHTPDMPPLIPSWSPNLGGAVTALRPETSMTDSLAAERRAAAGGLLVGGIVGYFIGRRRGRIKTEKRLLPIQKKLEEEVGALYAHIAQKEVQVRRLVRERAETEQLQVQQGKAHASELAQALESSQSPREAIKQSPLRTKETVRARHNDPTEHLGLMTIKALETEPLKPPRPEKIVEVKPLKQSIETMPRDQLLELSEQVVVGATTLRRVFETNLISERGLRRAVAEHRTGGDVRRVLAEELLIKEMSYERDPLVRDRPQSTGSQTIAQDQAALANASILQHQDGTGLPAAASAATKPPFRHRRSSRQQVPPALVAANVAAFITLAVLLFILLITHL